MRVTIRGLIILCFSILFIFTNWSQTVEEPIEFSNSRLSALGGYHAALTDDIMTIFNNPAGFCSVPSEILLSEITLGITGPIFDVTGSLLNSSDDWEIAAANLLQGIYASIDLVGPLSVAFIKNGFSFSFFNWADISFEPRGTLNLQALAMENILLTTGYAYRIPIQNMALDIGLQLKGIFRGTVTSFHSALELMGILASEEYLSLLLDEKFLLSLGGGIDAGLRYSIGERFAFGLVARNAYTPTWQNNYVSANEFWDTPEDTTSDEYGIIPLDLSAGILFIPPLGIMHRYINNLKMMLDYNDILDFLTHPTTKRHWLLHLNLGLELNLLEALFVRGGFSQGLFCAGIGLDLSIFQINASMFGSELSAYPGVRPAYNMVIGFEFKL